METYAQKLEAMGIATSRIADLEAAMEQLHKALCKLDFGNLRKFTQDVGILGQLDMYARHNQVRNIAQDMYSMAIHDAYRNIDLDEFKDFSDKLFFQAEEAAEVGIPGAKMLCKSLISLRKKSEGMTGLSFSRLASLMSAATNTYTQQLELRNTHKYNDDNKHLDDWNNIGTVTTLKVIKRKTEEYDSGFNLVFVKVHSFESNDWIKTGLKDVFTNRGCSCVYDCCGCTSAYPIAIKHLADNVWVIKLSWYRNV